MSKIALIITALVSSATAGIVRLWPWPGGEGATPHEPIVVAQAELAEVVWAPGDFTGPLVAMPGPTGETMFKSANE